MEIQEIISDSAVINITGRLDLNSAEETQAKVFEVISELKNLELDLSGLEYIASSGLRVLLIIQQQMKEQNGNLKITNVSDAVSDVFRMTGFSDILTIE